MKLSAAQGRALLRAPDADLTALLLYGPDGGLVKERAAALTLAVAEAVDDPFRVAHLSATDLREDPARLADEAAALSLTGGRRAVRLRDAGDAQSDLIAAFLATARAAALVIVEAGDLGPRSRLRRLFERADNAATLPCYADDPETLDELITSTLGAVGLDIEDAARAYLVDRLGGDRLVSRSELEKLVLYMGPEGTERGAVTLDDAMACIGDSAALTLDDVAFAAADGDQARLERALKRSFLEGNGPVPALRATARHLQRLHLVSSLRDRGTALDAAMKSLRPPVFFKRAPAFRRQLGLWSSARLATALDIVLDGERACKATGAPQDALCSRALMRIAGAAGADRRRPS